LHTSFNRVETGSIRNIFLYFRFVAPSGEKSFHASVMRHNAEAKLSNLYQFFEVFNGIASCKIFCPSFMFHHFCQLGTLGRATSFLRGVQIVLSYVQHILQGG